MAYPASVQLAAEFETTATKLTDSSGKGNDLIAYGNGGSISTTRAKYGTGAYLTDAGNNGARVNTTVQDAIGASSTWTIQMWKYVPATERPAQISRGPSSYASISLLVKFFCDNSDTGKQLALWYNHSNLGSVAIGAGIVVDDAFNLLIICFNGTSVKWYVNGTLIYTLNTTVNIFADTATEDHFYIGPELGLGYGAYGFRDEGDRLIISTENSAGAEIVPLPDITSITPDNGTTAGGTAVTLAGTGFGTGATVAIGGNAATDVVIVSATEITCVTPAGAGIADVTVTNTDATADTLVGAFTFVPSGDPYYDADTIYNKNRLSTGAAWLLLFKFTLPGVATPIYLARNTENITWNEEEWTAYPVDIGTINLTADGGLPTVNVRVSNITRAIQSIVEASDGAVGGSIDVYFVYTDKLDDATPVYDIGMKILSAVCNEKAVDFSCGVEYSPNMRRPLWNYQKYICPYKYGDIRCGISDATKTTYPTCNKTLAECKERSNDARIGTELSIPGVYFG